tara:strand:+ start:6748 stop:7101 length:354 start_codon:yes stop_codon:yes gene_type:complete
MAYIDLTFNTINSSVNVGDTIYYSNPSTSGGFSTSNENVLIGDIESISDNGETTVIKVNCEAGLIPPTTSSFVFFCKNNIVNISSVKGYYGLIEFKNNSIEAAEMFSVACDISQSSK